MKAYGYPLAKPSYTMYAITPQNATNTMKHMKSVQDLSAIGPLANFSGIGGP